MPYFVCGMHGRVRHCITRLCIVVCLVIHGIDGVSSSSTDVSRAIVLTTTNHIALRGTVNKHMADTFARQMLARTVLPRYIFIDSPGGSVDDGLAMLRVMDTIASANVSCIAIQAMSMAFALFQRCADRIVLPTSSLMQHKMYISSDEDGRGLTGTLSEIRDYVEHLQVQEALLLEMQSQRIGVSAEWFANRTHSEWWLVGQAAVDSGCADRMASFVTCSAALVHAHHHHPASTSSSSSYILHKNGRILPKSTTHITEERHTCPLLSLRDK